MNRYLRVVIVIMILSVVAVMISDDAEAAYEYDSENNVLTISSNISNESGVKVWPWSDYKEEITDVVIDTSVTNIPSYLFIGLTSVTEINIPSSVRTIGDSAFEGCTSVTEMHIPDSVKIIGNCAFSGMISLKYVSTGSSLTDVGESLFSDTFNIEKLEIGSPKLKIEYSNNPFNGKDIPKDIEVVFTEIIKDIPDNMFYSSDPVSISSLTISMTAESIGAYSFYGCDIGEIILPSTVKEIDDFAFTGSDLHSVNLENITSLGRGAFKNCSSLTAANIESLDNLKDETFSGCTSLTEITFSNQLRNIGMSSLNGTSVSEIILPETLTAVGEYAFRDCKLLKESIIIGDLSTLGNGAFEGCTSLKKVTLQNVVNLGTSVFRGCPLTDMIAIGIYSNKLTDIPEDCNLYTQRNSTIEGVSPSPVTYYIYDRDITMFNDRVLDIGLVNHTGEVPAIGWEDYKGNPVEDVSDISGIRSVYASYEEPSGSDGSKGYSTLSYIVLLLGIVSLSAALYVRFKG